MLTMHIVAKKFEFIFFEQFLRYYLRLSARLRKLTELYAKSKKSELMAGSQYPQTTR